MPHAFGDIVDVDVHGATRRCVVTSVFPDGTAVLTPIPDGMTAEDVGTRFWPSIVQRPPATQKRYITEYRAADGTRWAGPDFYCASIQELEQVIGEYPLQPLFILGEHVDTVRLVDQVVTTTRPVESAQASRRASSPPRAALPFPPKRVM